jgi:hypothetical protein
VYELHDDNVVSICESTPISISYQEAKEIVEEKGAHLMSIEELHYYLKVQHKNKRVYTDQWTPIKSETDAEEYVFIGGETGYGETHTSLRGDVPDQTSIKSKKEFSTLCYTFNDC